MTSKYEFIDAEKANYPVYCMCEWLEVSKSGFYEWRDRAPSETEKRRKELKTVIQFIFTESDGTYGHRRVHAELARLGRHVGLELVRKLMRRLGLVPCQPRPWRPVTTIAGDAAAIPDLLRRDFSSDAPGTSPTFAPGKDGSTWQPWSTAKRRRASDTPQPITCGPTSSSRRWTWPPGTIRWPRASYSTPTAARNTLPRRSRSTPRNSGSAAR